MNVTKHYILLTGRYIFLAIFKSPCTPLNLSALIYFYGFEDGTTCCCKTAQRENIDLLPQNLLWSTLPLSYCCFHF